MKDKLIWNEKYRPRNIHKIIKTASKVNNLFFLSSSLLLSSFKGEDVKDIISNSVYNSLNISSYSVITSDIGHNIASILSGLAYMSTLWRFLDDNQKNIIILLQYRKM
jgi:hypothetical protein